jgi:hypothetical protein
MERRRHGDLDPRAQCAQSERWVRLGSVPRMGRDLRLYLCSTERWARSAGTAARGLTPAPPRAFCLTPGALTLPSVWTLPWGRAALLRMFFIHERKIQH